MIERESKSKVRVAGGVFIARIILVAVVSQFPFACASSTRPTAAPTTPAAVTALPPLAPVALPLRPQVLRIRDTVRMKNEVPNELVGMGLVLGLQGTGDGGDFLPTQSALTNLMKHFDAPIATQKDYIRANDVAIVSLSMSIPPTGAHMGERLDIKVSALAAKSLKGGQLFLVPMYAPRTDVKIALACASGTLSLPDETQMTQGVIVGGGVLIEDILPEAITDTFTFVIHPNLASRELATAIAEQINEDVATQTGGGAIAFAVDATSVRVTIPQAERANSTPFIARLLALPLPRLD